MALKDYLIFHPARATVWDLLCLVFSSKSLAEYDHIVETNNPELLPPMCISTRLFLLSFILFSITSSSTCKVGNKFLNWLEYFLNKLHFNGGFIRLVWNTITGSSRSPDQHAAYYQSVQSFASGHIEYRKNLIAPVLINRLDLSHQVSSLMELAALASSLAYENRSRIEDIVNNHFNMDFVEFFRCLNVFVGGYTTKAFICCSKEEDAELIVVAFRSTDGLGDWRCNYNFSFITLGDMGKVHLGFMTALGLQDKHDTEKGFPKEYNGDKSLAYYSIKKVLNDLVKKHKNAKILVTGHSLGGALAVLFTSLLVMHEEQEILDRISWVMTFGQPRVGDATFGNKMVSVLGDKYTRMVYRHDIAPRFPFEIPDVIHFKHSGTFISNSNRFHGKKVKEVANKNYFNIWNIVVKFWGAIEDFFLAIWEWEGFISILARFIWIMLPGVAFHNTKNYVNATRKAKIDHYIIK
ncbi:hypothetical protein J5N97_014381 [Dioscorea zingiberensis]|uniref:Fungal lipase-type domain-containing protein n=1 Tax=Dioscorea zingiberensis TaxID=325984 RepID=A0A9D5CTU3_9LILI|nr:hypothetical protein J5N97_014381 [Dioscorea zingiberensis]